MNFPGFDLIFIFLNFKIRIEIPDSVYRKLRTYETVVQ